MQCVLASVLCIIRVKTPNETARPEALVGPFLYFLSADAGKRTGEHIVIASQAADAVWAGDIHGA